MHLYVGRKGLVDNPIQAGEWLAAARRCDYLSVKEVKSGKGDIHHDVALKIDKDARLTLTVHGLIHAQNPTEELVVAMFELANLLEAGVYSERCKQYRSVEEWERKTRRSRRALEVARTAHRRSERLKQLLWAAFIMLSAVVGWFASTHGKSHL